MHHTTAVMWLEDNLKELLVLALHLGSGDWTNFIELMARALPTEPSCIPSNSFLSKISQPEYFLIIQLTRNCHFFKVIILLEVSLIEQNILRHIHSVFALFLILGYIESGI